MKWMIAIGAVASALVLAACGSGGTEPQSPTVASTAGSERPSPSPSRTTQQVVMPDVVGMTGSDAVEMLERLGFELNHALSDEELGGVVTSTTPQSREGQSWRVGTSVTVRVETAADAAAKAQATADAEATRVETEICAPERDRKANVTAVSEDAYVIYLLLNSVDLGALGSSCPEFAADIDLARRAVLDGNYAVGVDIPAGGYETMTGGVEGCYWSRVRADGSIIANDFISYAPGKISVTVHDGEGVEFNGCGIWIGATPVR